MVESNAISTVQRDVLEKAAFHPEGAVVWFPYNLNGAVRDRVLNRLINCGYVERVGSVVLITDKGKDVLRFNK